MKKIIIILIILLPFLISCGSDKKTRKVTVTRGETLNNNGVKSKKGKRKPKKRLDGKFKDIFTKLKPFFKKFEDKKVIQFRKTKTKNYKHYVRSSTSAFKQEMERYIIMNRLANIVTSKSNMKDIYKEKRKQGVDIKDIDKNIAKADFEVVLIFESLDDEKDKLTIDIFDKNGEKVFSESLVE